MAVTTAWCNPLDDPSLDLVSAAHQTYSNYASDAVTMTMRALDATQQFAINPYVFNVAFQPSTDWWSVVRPAAPPAAPNTAFNPNVVDIGEAPDSDIGEVAFQQAPEYEGGALPDLPERPSPAALAVEIPAMPAVPAEPVWPVAPDTTGPTAPELVDTQAMMPDRPELVITAMPELDPIGDLPPQPELRPVGIIPPLRQVLFAGVRPTMDFEPPPNTFAFTPEAYSSVLMDKVTGRLAEMLRGGTGLPDDAAAAMRARAFAQVDMEETRAIRQATEEFASRGFEEPNGILTRRLGEVRQNSQNQRSALNRDILIEDTKYAIENLRFAVTQGVAFESALSQAHVDRMKVALDAAKAAAQVGIDLYNARASVFNLELSAYQTDASVFTALQNAAVEELRGQIAAVDADLRCNGQLVELWQGLLGGCKLRADINLTRIQGVAEANRSEQVRVDLYRAENEAVRIVGEQNAQRVQLFAEQTRALLAGVQVFDTTTTAAGKLYDNRMKVFDAWRDQIAGVTAQIGAKNAEWEGFTAQLNADTARLRPHELYTQIFQNRMTAWERGNNSLIEQQRLKKDGRELDHAAWRSRLEAIRTLVDADRQRVSAEVDIFRGGIDRYRAEASVEDIVAQGNERAFRLGLEQQRAVVDTALKNVELQLNQILANTQMDVELRKSITQIRAQLAAAAMSAVNYSASVGGSYGHSLSCGTSISYSGSLDNEDS